MHKKVYLDFRMKSADYILLIVWAISIFMAFYSSETALLWIFVIIVSLFVWAAITEEMDKENGNI